MEEQKEFKNGDAYKVMSYQCKTCGYKEIIWNSRNAVSPFTVNCPVESCDGISYHIDWHNDFIDPNYKLSPGQRYFADFTAERAKEVVEQMADQISTSEFDHVRFQNATEREDYITNKIFELTHSECSMDILTYQPEIKNSEFLTKCLCCGVKRIAKPTPGSCPCCFGNIIKAAKGSKVDVYTCQNAGCYRVCSSDYLSGFWSGWDAHNEFHISRIVYEVMELKKDLLNIEKINKEREELNDTQSED